MLYFIVKNFFNDMEFYKSTNLTHYSYSKVPSLSDIIIYIKNNDMDKKIEPVNKYKKWVDMAYAVDQWRIFPRIFISTYIYLLYAVVIWYMDLSNPTMEQSGLVSIVVGAGAAWFGLYTGSSKK